MRKTMSAILTIGMISLAASPAFAMPILRISIGVPKIVVAGNPAPVHVIRPFPVKPVYVQEPAYRQETDRQVPNHEDRGRLEHPEYPDHPFFGRQDRSEDQVRNPLPVRRARFLHR